MKSALYSILLASLPSTGLSELLLRKEGVMWDSRLSNENISTQKIGPAKPDPAGEDLVLFENGDLMHGEFGGIEEGLIWNRKDIDRPIKFGLPSVRQVVFKGGAGVVLEQETSFITLVSGDRIPGKIVSLDEKSLTIKSSIVGDLTIPREHIASLSPNPFDGELFYSGPYTSDGWVVLDYRKTKEQKEAEAKAAEEQQKKKEKADKADEKQDAKKEEKKEKEKSSAWIHSGASFYNIDNRPLAFPDANLPDIGRIKFSAEWKGRLNLTLALHSDFTRVLPPIQEEAEEEKEDAEEEGAEKEEGAKEENQENKEDVEKEEAQDPEPAPLRKEKLADLRNGEGFQNIPWVNSAKKTHADMFGTGYTMTLYSSYPSLSRNYFSDTGVARTQRMSSVRSNISLSEGGQADIEIRYDRKKALMMLFINGNYAAQWNDLAGFPGDGTGFGIMNNTSSAKVRISDVLITSWNGMTDSAKSMSHPERDLVLLANGTDRYSGQVTKISDGLAHLESDFVNAKIPIKDLSQVILKKSTATDLDSDELPEKLNWESDPVLVAYKPFGKIKINPTSAKGKMMKGTSPFLGDITIDLSAATLLRFTESSPDISDWFDDL